LLNFNDSEITKGSLGRSSGKGAFSIWTHNLKGIEWHDSFVPWGAPIDTSGVPAVTLQAGEQWFGVCLLGLYSIFEQNLS
jgi:hypothetical protein